MNYNYEIIVRSINNYYGRVVYEDKSTSIALMSILLSKAKQLKEYIDLLNIDNNLWDCWDNAPYSVKSRMCHIRVHRNYNGIPYTHHGIYSSNYEVYHFASFENGDNIFFNANNNDIICTSFSHFKRDDLCVEYYNPPSPFNNYEILQRAKSKESICKGEYNLITNNCEHFANWCYLGKSISSQIDSKNKLLETLMGI